MSKIIIFVFFFNKNLDKMIDHQVVKDGEVSDSKEVVA